MIKRRPRGRRLIIGTLVVFLAAGAWIGFKLLSPAPPAVNYLERSAALVNEGKLQEALFELKTALSEAPANEPANWALGQLYIELGDGLSAEKHIRQAAQLGHPAAEVELSLLRARLVRGDFEGVLGATLTLSDPPPELLMIRGEAQLGLGMAERAHETFARVLEREPDHPQARRALAQAALYIGSLEEAEQEITVALERSEEDLSAWLVKGEIAIARGAFEQAEQAFEKALALRPDHLGARLGLAQALLEQKKATQAEQTLGPVLEINPSEPGANYLLAVAASYHNDYERAKAALRVALSTNPDDLNSALLLGAIYRKEGDYEAAEAEVSRVVLAAPEALVSRKLLAAIQMARGRTGDGLETLQRGLQWAPDDPEFLTLLGNAYVRNGDADTGAQYLEQAIDLTPTSAGLRTHLAVSRLGAGHTEQGISDLHAALELDPDFARADMLLLVTHLRRKEFDSALELGQQVIERHPEDPAPLNLMGRAFEGKRDLAKARQSYEAALEIDPDFSLAAINLARLDLQQSKPGDARKRYEAILERRAHHPGALVRLAALVYREEGAQAGLDLLEEARKFNPRDLPSRLMLGELYLRQSRARQAMVVAGEAHALRPRLLKAALLLGRAQMAAGERSAALDTFSALAEQYPESPVVHFELATAQATSRQMESARSSFERVLELSPNHLGASLSLGRMALSEGNPEQAIAIAEHIEKAHPEAAGGYALKGWALFNTKKFSAAVKSFEKALELGPEGRLVIALSNAHYAAGDPKRGEQTLRKWLSEHPNDTATRLRLAEVVLTSGDEKLAIDEYEQVLTEAPDNVFALNNLAFLYQDRDMTRALELAERAFALAPHNPAVLDTLGWLLVQVGRSERALQLLHNAVAQEPSALGTRYHLAVALSDSGSLDEARRVLGALIDDPASFRERAEAEALLEKLQ